MNELEQAYLAHHGILGQKWHKKNGPPYPLDASDHSASEKDAGYKKSLNGGHNEDMYDRKVIKKEARQITKQLNKTDKEIARNRRDANDSYKAINKLYNKAQDRIAKGKPQFTKRQEKKYLDNFKKNLEANEQIKKGEEETKKILDSIPDTMDLRKYVVPRDVQKTSEHILLLAAGVLSSRTVPGIEYRVKAKSKKELAKVKENNYKKNMDLIQEKYDLAHEKEKEYLKKHPGAKEGEDYDFVEKFYTKADEEIEKKYKR